MAGSAFQPLVVAEVVEDPVGGTEEAFVVEREVVPLKEANWLSRRAGVDYYLIQDDGCIFIFKVTLLCELY